MPGLLRHHLADRDAPGEDAVDPGGDHPIPDPHVRQQRDVVEDQRLVAAAAHHPPPAGALDHGADGGRAVGHQEHLGVAVCGDDDAPHQPSVGDHRLVVPRPLAAGVDHQGAEPGGTVDVHHVGDQEALGVEPRVVGDPRQPLELLLDPLETHQLAAHGLDLLVQAAVLLAQGARQPKAAEEASHSLGRGAHRVHQGAQGAEHQTLERASPGLVLGREEEQLSQEQGGEQKMAPATVHRATAARPCAAGPCPRASGRCPAPPSTAGRRPAPPAGRSPRAGADRGCGSARRHRTARSPCP